MGFILLAWTMCSVIAGLVANYLVGAGVFESHDQAVSFFYNGTLIILVCQMLDVGGYLHGIQAKTKEIS